MNKNLVLLIVILTISVTTFGQVTRKFIDTGSVKNQFNYLIDKSNRYQEYKVVKINWLRKLKLNVADSLSKSKQVILSNYNIINTQKNTIDSLNLSLKTSENSIRNLNTEKQSISFLGIQFQKTVFKTIIFLIIGGLTFLLVYFITKFKQSNIVTQQTLVRLKETEDEFDSHRKIALEREQKVMRKLQDELNKQKKE